MSLTELHQPEKNWFVAQTKPNAWQIAKRNLERQAFEVFVPLIAQSQRLRGKIHTVRRPAFQGYVFVRFDPDLSPWRAINSTFGVGRLVAFGGGVVPTMVPPHFITGLWARCDDDCVLHDCAPSIPSSLRPGNQVRVTGGPFTDTIAQVLKLGPQQRVWVLMEVMGGPTSVLLPSSSLTMAAA